MKRGILSFAIAMALSACALADPITLTLNPSSGNVVGAAGTVVGWGFTLANTSSDWVVLDVSQFVPTAGSNPSVGKYNDFLTNPPFNFYVAGPGSTIFAAFDANSMSGLGEFLIDPITAQPGTNAHGNIIVTYSVFADAALTNPVLPDHTLSAPASISVPEPSFLTLLISALLLPLTYKGWRRYFAVRNSSAA